ncbi:MAG: hypothetical protein ACRCSX_08635 [Allorhizobium sp.]
MGLLAVGPIGCYILYYLLFVVRLTNPDEYPYLFEMSSAPIAFIDVLGALFALFVTAFSLFRRRAIDSFSPTYTGLSSLGLALIVCGVFALMLMSIYRVLGTLNLSYIIENYAHYQFYVTNGGAWIVLACYTALYIILLDMYYSGVRVANYTALMTSVIFVSFSGGRGIIILFVLTFLVLLMLQKIRVASFALAAMFTAAVMALMFFVTTQMRDTRTGEERKIQRNLSRADLAKIGASGKFETPETESFEDLNYNAAFIQEDVLAAIKSGKVTPGPYFINDAAVRLIPRSIMPEKPVSTSETIALYPHVAQRGTNITFPLKANLMMHVGIAGYWLDWLVVAIAGVVFSAGVAQRADRPQLWSFAAIFFGCAFALVARAGILNARLLDQALAIIVAYAAYRIALAVFSRKRGCETAFSSAQPTT